MSEVWNKRQPSWRNLRHGILLMRHVTSSYDTEHAPKEWILFPITKFMSFRHALGMAANNVTSGKHFLNTCPSSTSVHSFQTLAKQNIYMQLHYCYIHLNWGPPEDYSLLRSDTVQSGRLLLSLRNLLPPSSELNSNFSTARDGGNRAVENITNNLPGQTELILSQCWGDVHTFLHHPLHLFMPLLQHNQLRLHQVLMDLTSERNWQVHDRPRICQHYTKSYMVIWDMRNSVLS